MGIFVRGMTPVGWTDAEWRTAVKEAAMSHKITKPPEGGLSGREWREKNRLKRQPLHSDE